MRFPIVADSAPLEDAQDALADAGLGDGLPLVPPTQDRLERMLDGVAEPDVALATIPPLRGPLTAATAAYFAVLAGCRPAELRVVLAAARACAEPEFNLLGVLTTTGCAAVGVLVHGEVVTDLGLNAGANCLGPGNRANACIGRAVALLLTGLGGARPGAIDMATIGQPAKYTLCAAEATRGPLPGLSERRGLRGSGVTVLAVNGMAEVIPAGAGATTTEVLDPLVAAITGAAHAAGDPARLVHREQFVLLPPEPAATLMACGETLVSIQRYVFDALAGIASTPDDIQPVIAGGVGVKALYLPPWGGTRSVTRAL